MELIALLIRAPEVASDLLFECIEPETSRVLIGRPTPIQQFVKCIIGIPLDHINETGSNKKPIENLLKLILNKHNNDAWPEYQIDVKRSLEDVLANHKRALYSIRN